MPQHQKEGTTANFCAMVALITGANENSTWAVVTEPKVGAITPGLLNRQSRDTTR